MIVLRHNKTSFPRKLLAIKHGSYSTIRPDGQNIWRQYNTILYIWTMVTTLKTDN